MREYRFGIVRLFRLSFRIGPYTTELVTPSQSRVIDLSVEVVTEYDRSRKKTMLRFFRRILFACIALNLTASVTLATENKTILTVSGLESLVSFDILSLKLLGTVYAWYSRYPLGYMNNVIFMLHSP